jgi:FkbM family methyltransferase
MFTSLAIAHYAHITIESRGLMKRQKALFVLKMILKKSWLVWILLSGFSSLRSLRIVGWKFDGSDWMLRDRHQSVFTDRYEPKSTWLLEGHKDIFEHKYRPKASDRILDVGGGLGLDLPRWSKLVGQHGHIWVIEPDDDAYRRCSKLIENLPIQNVTIIKKALGASPGVATLAKVSGNSHKNFIIDSKNTKGNTYETQLVDVVTLDEIFNEYNMGHIDFCKINVEGFEVHVLKGAALSLGSLHNLVISCHDFLGEEFATFDEVSLLLKSFGFSIETNQFALSELESFYLYAERNRIT